MLRENDLDDDEMRELRRKGISLDKRKEVDSHTRKKIREYPILPREGMVEYGDTGNED